MAFKKWWIQQRSFQKVVDFNEEAFKKWWGSMEKNTQKWWIKQCIQLNLTKFPINAMKDSDVICYNNVYMHYTLFWGRGDSDVICFNNVFIYVTLFLEVGGYYQTCHFSYSVCVPSIFFWQKIWCRICTAEIKIISVRSVRLLQHF